MFTLDTESGFDQVVFITSSWGLGEDVLAELARREGLSGLEEKASRPKD